MKPFDRNIVLDRIKTLNRRKNKVRKEIGRPVEMEKKSESTRYRHWKRMSQR